MLHSKRTFSYLLLILSIGLLTGFGVFQQSHQILLGYTPTLESRITAEYYRQWIEKETNYKVKKLLFANQKKLKEAISDKSIHLYLGYLPSKEYQESVNHLIQSYQLAVGSPIGFDNRYVLLMKKDTSQQLHIRTVSELKEVSHMCSLGFNQNFSQNPLGLEVLNRTYHSYFDEYHTYSSSPSFIINDQDVEVIATYSTNTILHNSDLLQLKDDQNAFPKFLAAPIVQSSILRKKQLFNIIMKSTRKISNQDMIQLKYKIEVLNQDLNTVVYNFLNKK